MKELTPTESSDLAYAQQWLGQEVAWEAQQAAAIEADPNLTENRKQMLLEELEGDFMDDYNDFYTAAEEAGTFDPNKWARGTDVMRRIIES